MNILILVNSFPPNINSAAHLYHELAVDLKNAGHKIEVITENSPDQASRGKHRNRLFLYENLDGLNVCRIPPLENFSNFPGGKAIRYFLSCLLYAFHGILAGKADVILVYSPPLLMGLAGYLIAKAARIKFVINIQDIHPKVLIDMGFINNKIIISILKKLEDFIYSKSTYLIIYSQGNKDYLSDKGIPEDKSVIIPNWVDTDIIAPSDKINPLRNEYNLTDKFIVSYAGTIGPAQGLEVLIQAALHLKEYKDIMILIVGDGDFKDHLETEAGRQGINNILFLPTQSKEKYISLLQASDVCLLLLSREAPPQTVPGKLANLMACGRPIIAAVNQGGEAARIIEEADCGYCLAPGEGQELSQAIIALYKNPGLRERLAHNGRRFAEENLSRKVSVAKFDQVLRTAQA